MVLSEAHPEREESVAALARNSFADWVDEAPDGRVFGQTLVRGRDSSVGYEIRHIDDVGTEYLEVSEDARSAREISKLAESGDYRPLKSSPNLRRGWLLRLKDVRELVVAMNYLYPAAIVHWYLHREGRLGITNFRETAARQSGIYERIRHLSDRGVRDAARACCEDAVCLKKTLWDVDESKPLDMNRGRGEIPCPEPCSIFVSFARRVRAFERERETGGDYPGFSRSEREDLASLVEAAASGNVEMAREAEFEKPLNERRMRYRAITLLPGLRSED